VVRPVTVAPTADALRVDVAQRAERMRALATVRDAVATALRVQPVPLVRAARRRIATASPDNP